MSKRLIEAVQSGDKDRVQYLLSHGVDVNFKDERGWTALHYAASKYASIYGFYPKEITQILIDAKADVNIFYGNTPFKETLLYKAIWDNSTNLVELLLKANAKIHFPETQDIDLLNIAIDNGNATIVKLLIDAGADVNRKYSDGQTPLHRAAHRGLTEIIELLLIAGASADIVGKDCQGTNGITPLIEAIRGSYYKQPQGFVERSNMVAWGDNIKAVEMLLIAGGDIAVHDDNGHTPLHFAAANSHDPAMTELLLQKGAIIDGVTNTGKRAVDLLADRWMLSPKVSAQLLAAEQLLKAAKTGCTASLDSILSCLGTALNARSIFQKNTALHIALVGGKLEFVLRLLRAGADINITNEKGETASELMRKSRYPHIRNIANLNHALLNLNKIKITVSRALMVSPIYAGGVSLANIDRVNNETVEKEGCIQKLRYERFDSFDTQRNASSQSTLELRGKMIRESIKQAGFDIILKHIQPYIDQILEMITNLTDSVWHKERNYICYHLGMLLSGKFIQDFVKIMPKIEAERCNMQGSYFQHYLGQYITDIKEDQLEIDTLVNPMDSVQAYNILCLVTQEIGQKQYALVQSLLFMLLFEKKLHYLMKNTLYPTGPFIAIGEKDAQEQIRLKQREYDAINVKLSDDDLRDLLFDINRDQAILEHLLLSGPKNVHRAVLDKFLARRIDQTIEVSGIPGFKDFNHTPSERSLFDKIDEIRKQDVALKESMISQALSSAEERERESAARIVLLQKEIRELMPQLAQYGEFLSEMLDASELPLGLEDYSDDENAARSPLAETSAHKASDSRLTSLLPPFYYNPTQNFSPFSQEEGGLLTNAEEPEKKPMADGQGDADKVGRESSSSLPEESKVNRDILAAQSKATAPGSLETLQALPQTDVILDQKQEKEAAEQGYALHLAIQNGDIEKIKACIKKIHKKGAYDNNILINQEDENGWTPLQLAAEQGNLNTVAMLLASGAIVNKENKNKETALHFAAIRNHQAIIKLLLSHGALLNHANTEGKIPRLLAKDITLFKAAEDLFDVVESDTTISLEENILLSLGNAINARAHRTQDRLGDSALHIAIRKEKLDLIIRLLQANANFTLLNSNLESPLNLMENCTQPYIRAVASLLRIKMKLVHSESHSKSSQIPLESYQRHIDAITNTFKEFPEDKYRYVRDYICFELGMRLVKGDEAQLNFDALKPIDPVLAYNFLKRVSVHFGIKQFALVNTILFMLIKNGHVCTLKKNEHYPEGPFIAFVGNHGSKEVPSRIKALDDPEEDEMEALVLSHRGQSSETRSYEMNRRLTMALYEHHRHSGSENPYKKLFVDALIAFLIDRSFKIKSLPGFKDFTDISSLRLLFDTLAELRQDEIIHTENEVSRIKEASAAKLNTMTNYLEILEARLKEYKFKLAHYESSRATNTILKAVTEIAGSESNGLMPSVPVSSGVSSSSMTFIEHSAELIFLGPNRINPINPGSSNALAFNSALRFSSQSTPQFAAQTVAQIEIDEKTIIGSELIHPKFTVLA